MRMRNIIILSLLTGLLLLTSSVFAEEVLITNDQEVNSEYNNALSERDQARESYNNIAENYWWVISGPGGILEDNGDTLYLFGNFGSLGDSNTYSSVNIKIVNVNRNLINLNSYDFIPGGMTRPHVYLGTEEGYNSLNQPVTIYVLQYSYDAENQLAPLRERLEAAEKKVAELDPNRKTAKPGEYFSSDSNEIRFPVTTGR